MPMWWLRDACFFLPLWPLEFRKAPLEWRSSIETANGELQGSLLALLRAAGKCEAPAA